MLSPTGAQQDKRLHMARLNPSVFKTTNTLFIEDDREDEDDDENSTEK